MRIGTRQLVFVIASPLLSVALLGAIVAEQQTHLKPQDVEPFHSRARELAAQIPYVIGYWTGTDDEVPVAAQKLLRPNVILMRTFVDNSPNTQGRMASLLIVQCRDSRDMVGHYPPVCYRSQGMTQDDPYCGPRDWIVKSGTETVKIPGYEYHFTEVLKGEVTTKVVYNFLIVPGRGIVRDMKGVEQAAEDYQQRYYGAAQFQVVFYGKSQAAEPSREQRDEIFATLMGPNLKLVETLSSGVLQ